MSFECWIIRARIQTHTHTHRIRNTHVPNPRPTRLYYAARARFCKLCIQCEHFTVIRTARYTTCRSQWPRGLRRRSAAARLLRSWVRIPPEAWIFVCCECRVLSGRGLCDELITRPTYCSASLCVRSRNLKNEEAMTRVGSQRHKKKIYTTYSYFSTHHPRIDQQ